MNYLLSELPFYSLNDRDFLKAAGSWVYHTDSLIDNIQDLFGNVIDSPVKEDDLNMSTIESKYHNIKQMGNYLKKTSTKGLSIMSCNTRSLQKNLNYLHDILITVNETPSIIVISETKLSDNSINNISIPGYHFVKKNSKSNAGGVGLYVKEDLKFHRRSDLELEAHGLETYILGDININFYNYNNDKPTSD